MSALRKATGEVRPMSDVTGLPVRPGWRAFIEARAVPSDQVSRMMIAMVGNKSATCAPANRSLNGRLGPRSVGIKTPLQRQGVKRHGERAGDAKSA